MGRHALQDEQVAQSGDYAVGVELALNPDCQTFTTVFIEDVQRPEHLAVVCPAVDEAVVPDMVPILRPKPDA